MKENVLFGKCGLTNLEFPRQSTKSLVLCFKLFFFQVTGYKKIIGSVDSRIKDGRYARPVLPGARQRAGPWVSRHQFIKNSGDYLISSSTFMMSFSRLNLNLTNMLRFLFMSNVCIFRILLIRFLWLLVRRELTALWDTSYLQEAHL